MMASSFGKPLRFGRRTCRSGLPPATHAAAASVRRGGASVRDHAPLGAGQRREPRADRLGQLVEVHVLLSGRIHRRPHLRQHRRSADDGEGPASVDQRPHADGLVDVGDSGVKPGRRGSHRRCGGLRLRSRGGRQRHQASKNAASSNQIPAGDAGLAHSGALLGEFGRCSAGPSAYAEATADHRSLGEAVRPRGGAGSSPRPTDRNLLEEELQHHLHGSRTADRARDRSERIRRVDVTSRRAEARRGWSS